jgi:hypothetical protein
VVQAVAVLEVLTGHLLQLLEQQIQAAVVEVLDIRRVLLLRVMAAQALSSLESRQSLLPHSQAV